MVPVTKKVIADGKPEKAETKRRPRNQELNSSKKTVSVTHGETHATEQNPFKAKLNCSRKLNCSVTGNITSDVYDKLYTREDDPQKVADVIGCTVEDVKEIDSETEDLGYGKTVGYLLAKPEYEEELSQNGIEILSILEDGTVGMMVGRGFHTVETDLEWVLDRIGENLDSACGGKDKLNCRRWDWDRWDEYGTPSKVTPEIQQAVDAELEDVDIVKVLIPKGAIKDYLLRMGIQALVFVQDSENPASYEEIVGWDGNSIIQDSFNLADIQDNALSGSAGSRGLDSACGGKDKLNSSDESAEDTSLDEALEYLSAGNVPEIQDARVFDNEGRLMVLYPDAETGKYMLLEATITGEPISGDKVMEDYLKSTGSLDSSKGSKSLNSSADEETNLDDTKITTESGNEVSMQDIKIVQNPDTNELAIFIPEDEEETIPEGFTVIGMVIPDAVDATPAIEEESETGDSVESDESLNSSRQEAAPANREQRRHPNHRKLNSAKRRK